ncbi:hypothetical protein MSHOH_1563 [Methanosarcina horonobensis HB-1 = JCM 15518]|uniref:Uncharacterized protein n=2 Tax=Methanosarcina horonobensis TaxID=418008 RepID=A0A0E3SB38_9EURY|nr:hypothetical protein [Methanosarcina horonobensis]AKB78046.1 hypothetical protein MSHOH_1563 [Methanosarcina horonobensis HB-1 = JCM 15518]
MNVYLVFAVIWAAMIANAFWEAYVEGREAGNRGKLGWKITFCKNVSLTAYHFFLFFIMWPLLLMLPLAIVGWDSRLFGILVSAYFSGLIIEDFAWFVVNPVVSLSEWNPTFVNYYPWIVFGKIKIPLIYISHFLIALISWQLFWTN